MPHARVAALLLAAAVCGGCAGSTPEEPGRSVSVRSAGLVERDGPGPAPGSTQQPPDQSPTPGSGQAVVQRGDGRLTVVPGGTGTVGDGPLRTYAVEVEGGLGVDPAAFAAAVDRTLADPRSWTDGGRRSLRRVDGPADLRVALVSPDTVDRLCAPLRTAGRYSCANGDRAVINLARWQTGAAAYAGHLQDYRAYVVNHEVGHTLGFGHARCPAPGRTAPVMVQQTKGLGGCARGPWPYP